MAAYWESEGPHVHVADTQCGRRQPPNISTAQPTVLASEGPSRVALAAARAFAHRPAVLNIVAHQDDDLLFLSPDLLHAIQAGSNVRTIYLTAGDSGLRHSYPQDRESGVRAAYAEMARVANSWTQSDAGVSDHPIPVFTLNDRRNISLAFMRLPDGCFNGSGFATNSYQSLQGVWTGANTTIDAIDKSSSYTLRTLTSTLAYLIMAFEPECVNTLDYRHAYGDGDHSDHHSVGYLTRSAIAHCSSPVTLVGYEGYPVIPLPANVSDADQKAKQSAFLAYARHDRLLQDYPSQHHPSNYDLWVARQYTLNQPRSLFVGCRGLIWRGVRRMEHTRWLEAIPRVRQSPAWEVGARG